MSSLVVILIKEIKFGSIDELSSLIIKFIAMSDKKNQQEIINKVKDVLKIFGFDGF